MSKLAENLILSGYRSCLKKQMRDEEMSHELKLRTATIRNTTRFHLLALNLYAFFLCL